MSEQTKTQTRNPRRFVRDPKRHYLRIQVDGGGYESPLEDILSRESIVKPGEDMYRMDSDDKRDTGHRKMVLVSCSNEDYDAMMQRNEQEALGTQRAVKAGEQISGGVLTSD